MSTNIWEEIRQANTTLAKETSDLLVFLSDLTDSEKKSFNTLAVIPETDSSTSHTAMKILAVSGVIAGSKVDEQIYLVPSATQENTLDAIKDTANSIQALLTHLKLNFKENDSLETFDYSNFHSQTSNGHDVDCLPQFQQFHASVETLLGIFLTISPILSESAGDFQSVASTFDQLFKRVSTDRDKIGKTLTDLNDISSKAESLRATTKTISAEVHHLKEISTHDQQTISEYLAKVTSQQEEIYSIHSQASELKSTVTEYNESFQSFQRQLDDRESYFKKGTEELNFLIEKFRTQEASFDVLIAKSQNMLELATVAGLSAHFGKKRDELTKELNISRTWFYIAISTLFLSALPLLLLILWPIIEIFYPNLSIIHVQDNTSGLYYIGQIIARMVILLPAAWFVQFASRRHASLFKLREDYAYKYSMAFSVNGFKKQAPEYESQIAAIVFELLAFNPANKMFDTSKEGGESPSKLMNIFQRMVGKVFDKVNDSHKL